MEPVKAIAEWVSEHLAWLFGLPLGLLIAYILAYAFILGPRRARLALTRSRLARVRAACLPMTPCCSRPSARRFLSTRSS